MSFFEPPPPPPEPPQQPEMPEWLGPPDNVVPGTFPLELVLARTGDVALFVKRSHRHHPMIDWHAPGARTHRLRLPCSGRVERRPLRRRVAEARH